MRAWFGCYFVGSGELLQVFEQRGDRSITLDDSSVHVRQDDPGRGD